MKALRNWWKENNMAHPLAILWRVMLLPVHLAAWGVLWVYFAVGWAGEWNDHLADLENLRVRF